MENSFHYPMVPTRAQSSYSGNSRNICMGELKGVFSNAAAVVKSHQEAFGEAKERVTNKRKTNIEGNAAEDTTAGEGASSTGTNSNSPGANRENGIERAKQP